MPLKTLRIAAMFLAATVTIHALAQQNEAAPQKPSQAMSHQMAQQMARMNHGAATKRLKVAVLLYDGVEEIDYAGPGFRQESMARFIWWHASSESVLRRTPHGIWNTTGRPPRETTKRPLWTIASRR